MEIYQDRFISFPVHIVIRNHNWHIDSIPREWRTLTKSIVINDNNDKIYHTGILTGRKSKITVIKYNTFSSAPEGTLCIKTMDSYKYAIYNYESSLHSIYRPAGSILNDGCYILTGYNFKITENAPIAKMPQTMLDSLQEEQANREDIYDDRMIELVSIIPALWFDDIKNVNYIIDVMKSIRSTDVIRINTLRKILMRKCDSYNERDMISRIEYDDTYEKKKITLASLKKVISAMDRRKYELWARKWKPRTAKRLRYREGDLVLLAEVRKYYYNKELQERLERNTNLQIIRKSICKSCRNLFKVGCCDQYNKKNKSSAFYVLNGYLSY